MTHDTLYSIRETIVRRASFASEIVSNFDIFNFVYFFGLEIFTLFAKHATTGHSRAWPTLWWFSYFDALQNVRPFHAKNILRPPAYSAKSLSREKKFLTFFIFLCNAVKSSIRIINPRNAWIGWFNQSLIFCKGPWHLHIVLSITLTLTNQRCVSVSCRLS